jgi:hypothetical protein
MAEPETAATIREVVDTIFPTAEGRTGALEVGAGEHAVQQLDLFLEGFPDMAAALLNAYAMGVRPGATFAELTTEERVQVFREMAAEEAQDIREALDAIVLFAAGGTYSEHAAPAPGERPPTWDELRYPGPSDGYPDYRVGI